MPHQPVRPRFLAAVPAEPRPQPAPFIAGGSRPRREQRPEGRLCGDDQAAAAGSDAARRQALERVGEALQSLRAEASRLAEQAHTDALEVGFLVARKILETELRVSPEPLFALVKSALRRAGDSRRISLRVDPESAARLQGEQGRAELDGLTVARIEVFPDPALQPGDCLVETDYGQIDGRLETRLGELRRAVEATVEGAA